MENIEDVNKGYAILCGETSDAIDYLEDLVARLKAALARTEEVLCGTDNNT